MKQAVGEETEAKSFTLENVQVETFST